MAFGIRECRARRRFRQSQMPEFAFARLQALRDLPQRFRLRELTEQHGYQLSPTAEATRMALGVMLLYSRFEAVTRDQLENLAEDAAYSFQGEASSVGWIRSCQESN